MQIKPSGAILGATVTGVDLHAPLSNADFAALLRALGDHGVLCFPDQPIDAAAQKRFSERFGPLQVLSSSAYHEPGIPEVTILSNIKKDGKPVGKADAGQFWHTDATYNEIVGFVNVLVAHAVPMRGGKPLGDTEFVNTQAAYVDLPAAIRDRLANATAEHDLNNNWRRMAEKGSRPHLTAAQIAEHPPVSHPVFLTHPITGRKLIYVNPSHVVGIEGMDKTESQRTLDELFAHVMQPRYRYVHHWRVGDVLLWDHLGTWHNAVADYGPDEPRLMKRCQVMADFAFDPGFMRAALSA
jgi:taurine dioxygenase